MKNMYIERSPMQNLTDFRTPPSSTAKTTWTFSLNDIAIKVPKCTKYGINACNIFIFWFLSNILSFPSIVSVVKCDLGLLNVSL